MDIKYATSSRQVNLAGAEAELCAVYGPLVTVVFCKGVESNLEDWKVRKPWNLTGQENKLSIKEEPSGTPLSRF